MKSLFSIKSGLIIVLIFLVACNGSRKNNVAIQKSKTMALQLTSHAFKEGGTIPVQYTCAGKNISPPLAWTNAPEKTKSFALTLTDPDAPMGTWVHWVIFNIPDNTSSLKEHFPTDPDLPNGTKQGINDFKNHGYGGPCPPSGTHRYFFKLYALDTVLNTGSDINRKALEATMKGHIIEQAELMGRVSKQ